MSGGEHFSLALTHDRQRLYAFGRSDYGQLGIGFVEKTGSFVSVPTPVTFPEPVSIVEIDAGDRHALAITDKHELYTWGFNGTGPTGHPSDQDRDTFRPRLLNLTDHLAAGESSGCHVVSGSGGGQHSLILVKPSNGGIFKRAKAAEEGPATTDDLVG